MSEFRRVHRATPLLQFWTGILAIFAALVLNINASGLHWIERQLAGEGTSWWLLVAVGAFVLVCALVWWASGLWWRHMGFRIGGEELAIKHGVISTHLRTARYDRIQAVDVVEPVIARIFGVAKVRIETAGGNNSALDIMYLSKPEAETVRNEVLARVHGPVPEASAPIVNDALIPPIPIERTLLAAVLHPSLVLTIPALLGMVFVPGGVAAFLPILVGLVPWAWGVIDKSWQFTAALDDDSLNVSYGLADKRRQTVPLDRIHAVRVSQPLLWRITGWWRVHVSVAGYGVGDKQAGTTLMLPVGTREQAVDMLCALSPLSRDDVTDSVPLEGALTPTYRSPASARWLTPVDQKQQAVTLLGSRAVVLHAGRFSRRLSVVAPAHIQELSLTRGPLAHIAGVANVRFDLVPGPVHMKAAELSLDDAQRLLTTLRARELPGL